MVFCWYFGLLFVCVCVFYYIFLIILCVCVVSVIFFFKFFVTFSLCAFCVRLLLRINFNPKCVRFVNFYITDNCAKLTSSVDAMGLYLRRCVYIKCDCVHEFKSYVCRVLYYNGDTSNMVPISYCSLIDRNIDSCTHTHSALIEPNCKRGTY